MGGRELRELRRLASQRRPHPDPVLQRRAVAWARRPAPSAGRITAAVVAGTLGGAAVLAGAYNQAAAMIVLFGLPLTLVAVALAVGPLGSALIHRVNLSALLDNLAVPAEPLEVRPGSFRRRWLRQLPVFGVLVVNAVAAVAARAYSVTLFCLAVSMLGLVWSRRSRDMPRLPVRLDETGLSLPGVNVRIPWTGVTAVELASSVDPYWLGVIWRLPDSTVASDRVPPGLRRHQRSLGRRLVLWLDPRDHPPEKIVLTSRAYLATTPPADDEPRR